MTPDDLERETERWETRMRIAQGVWVVTTLVIYGLFLYTLMVYRLPDWVICLLSVLVALMPYVGCRLCAVFDDRQYKKIKKMIREVYKEDS